MKSSVAKMAENQHILVTFHRKSLKSLAIRCRKLQKTFKCFKQAFSDPLVPLFQNESKCETLHMKMSSACSFIFMQIKVIFIRMVFALRLALKQRHMGTRKWPINLATQGLILKPVIETACKSATKATEEVDKVAEKINVFGKVR